MTVLNSLLTNEGLLEIQDSRLNGKYLDIDSFGVSETQGVLNTSRTIHTINSMWVNIAPSGSDSISPEVQQINLDIPPEVLDPAGVMNTSNKNISEVYIFARTQPDLISVDVGNNQVEVSEYFYNKIETGDAVRFYNEDGSLPTTSPSLSSSKTLYAIKTATQNILKFAISRDNALNEIASLVFTGEGTGSNYVSKYFLFTIGQFTPDPILWVYTAGTNLRTQIELTNVNIPETVRFYHTQANEINSHNIDPNAHPYIQERLDYYGFSIDPDNFSYKGQNLYKDAVFHASVVNGDVVYFKASEQKFYPALAENSEKNKIVGVANTEDFTVRFGGIIHVPHSVDINSYVYLSDVTAGALTSSSTSVRVGRSLGNNLILWGSDSSGSVSYINDILDINVSSPVDRNFLIYNEANLRWENQIPSLSDLSDIDFTLAPSSGDVLINDGTNFVPAQLDLNNLADFDISSETTNDYLVFNGTNWVNQPLAFVVKEADGTPTYTDINQLEFGSGFVLTNSGTKAIINYTGSAGATAIIGLNDVESDFNIDSVDESLNYGLVLFDNRDSNANPAKVRFVSSGTNDQLLQDLSIFNSSTFINSGSLALGTYFSLYSLAIDFQELSEDYENYVLSGVMSGSGTSFEPSWQKANIYMQGASVTNATTQQKVFKLIFGTGLTGNFDNGTGALTINNSGSGIPSISNVTGHGINRPLVYSGGDSSNSGKLRGLIDDSGSIRIRMYDNGGTLTNDINACTGMKLEAYPYVSNISISSYANNTGINSATDQVVLPVSTSLESTGALKVRGIKGINGIYVKLQTDGSNQNVVIDGSGISGGGSGLQKGTTYDVTTNSLGLKFTVGSAEYGFISEGSGTNTGIGFYSNNMDAGFVVQNAFKGIQFNSNVDYPLYFNGTKTITSGFVASMPNGSTVYGTTTGGYSGLFLKLNGSLFRIAMESTTTYF